jgi:hypothetical protein
MASAVLITKYGPAHCHILDNRFATKAQQHPEFAAKLSHVSRPAPLNYSITASEFFTFIVMFRYKFIFSFMVFFFTFIFIFTFNFILVSIFIFVFFLLL